jgi:hypothetical protein
MYGIKLDGEFVLLNEGTTDYQRYNTFEEAVEAEALYPDFDTEIVEL